MTEVEGLKHMVSGLAGYALSCRKNNTVSWMEGLAEQIQVAARGIGDKNFFYFDGEQIRQRPAAAPVLKKKGE